MKRIPHYIVVCALLFLPLNLARAEGDAREPAAERTRLDARRQELEARALKLSQERDFLLFEKEFAVIDSKYLVLDPVSGRGQLKYRARVLLDFSFAAASKKERQALPPGPLSVTKKREDAKKRLELVFGPLLVLSSKDAATQDPAAMRIVLSGKEIRSVFFALEKGSMAYILP